MAPKKATVAATSPHSNNVVFRPDSKTLKNKGVFVTVNKVRQVTIDEGLPGQRYEYHAEGTEQFNVRLTNYMMAEIEENFGSGQEWLQQLTTRPYSVVLRTFQLLTDKPKLYVSEMVLGKHIEEYQYALVTAWSIAYGAGAEDMGKLAGSANAMGQLKSTVLHAVIDLWGQMGDSLGELGSALGSSTDETTTSSGDEPQPNSDSSSDATETNEANDQ